MSKDPIREQVSMFYAGPKWKRRVAGMTKEQIFAVYKAKQESDAKKTPDPKPEQTQDKLF